MATFTKFEQFSEDLGKGVHDLNGDSLKIYLTNTTPDVVTHALKGDLPGIAEGNGYASADITNVYSQTNGVGILTGSDITFTATGGSFGPFRYVILYNDSTSALVDPLIGCWDYGSSITITDTNNFIVDFGSSILELA